MIDRHRLLVRFATANLSFFLLVSLYRALDCGPFSDAVGGWMLLAMNLVLMGQAVLTPDFWRRAWQLLCHYRLLKWWFLANTGYLAGTFLYLVGIAWWWLPLSVRGWHWCWLIINLPFLAKLIYNFIVHVCLHK